MGTLIGLSLEHIRSSGGRWVISRQARRQASAWIGNGGHAALEQPHERRRCAVRIKIKINLYVSKQYIEDSVGNNVSLYIVAGGLPAYTSDEVVIHSFPLSSSIHIAYSAPGAV